MAYSTKGTVNKAEIIGRIGNDLELRHTQGGTAVLNVSLATNEKRGNEEVTSWHRCVIWGKTAEVVAKHCSKGNTLRVEGAIQYGEYTDRDGNVRPTTEIDVRDVTLLGGKPKDGQQQQQQQQTGRQQQIDDDEDIPF